MKHTPLTNDGSNILSRDGTVYCTTLTQTPRPILDIREITDEIILAVNSHNELLEALKNLVAKLDKMTTDQFAFGTELMEREAARAAIKKAEA